MSEPGRNMADTRQKRLGGRNILVAEAVGDRNAAETRGKNQRQKPHGKNVAETPWQKLLGRNPVAVSVT